MEMMETGREPRPCPVNHSGIGKERFAGPGPLNRFFTKESQVPKARVNHAVLYLSG